MNPNRLLRLELIVILALLYQWYRCSSDLRGFALWEVVLHRFFVMFYALIGTAGLHAAIAFCCNNEWFFEVFKAKNLLDLPGTMMCWIAALHGLLGIPFMVLVGSLDRLGQKSRRVAPLLALPCAVAYPLVMANLTNTVTVLKNNVGAGNLIFGTTCVAISGMWFYWFSPASEKMRHKQRPV